MGPLFFLGKYMGFLRRGDEIYGLYGVFSYSYIKYGFENHGSDSCPHIQWSKYGLNTNLTGITLYE